MKTARIIRSIGASVTLALLITGCAKSETASLPTPKNAIDFSPLVTRSVVTRWAKATPLPYGDGMVLRL